MTEHEFDMLLKQAITEHINEYIPETEIDDTPHKFSKRFERKMNKLMGKPTFSNHLSPKKIFLYVTVVVVATIIITSCVPAIREAFFSFITNVFATHTEVDSISDDNDPLDFTDKYEITVDISNYNLENFSEDVFAREYRYKNDDCKLIYNQYIKKYYKAYENTEGYNMEKIFINGFEGYYIDMNEINTKKIVWDNGDYIFSILLKYDVSGMDKTELIELAGTVHKIE